MLSVSSIHDLVSEGLIENILIYNNVCFRQIESERIGFLSSYSASISLNVLWDVMFLSIGVKSN